MSPRTPTWDGTVRLEAGTTRLARWLEQALAPEAAREVPRARTVLRRRGSAIELRIRAADAGAMRAAMNTYLGWIALSLATVRAAEPGPPEDAAARTSEALISRAR